MAECFLVLWVGEPQQGAGRLSLELSSCVWTQLLCSGKFLNLTSMFCHEYRVPFYFLFCRLHNTFSICMVGDLCSYVRIILLGWGTSHCTQC